MTPWCVDAVFSGVASFTTNKSIDECELASRKGICPVFVNSVIGELASWLDVVTSICASVHPDECNASGVDT